MRNFFIMALATFAALTFNSCKTTEANYKAAYDITKNRVKAKDGIDSVTFSKIEAEKTEATAVVAGDSVRLITHHVNIVDDSPSALKRYGVVVGEYKQVFNARSFRNRLKSEKEPAYVVMDAARKYYVIAHGFDTSIEASDYLKRLDKEVKMKIPIERPWTLARP